MRTLSDLRNIVAVSEARRDEFAIVDSLVDFRGISYGRELEVKRPMIAVIDYKAGNLTSVVKALSIWARRLL